MVSFTRYIKTPHITIVTIAVYLSAIVFVHIFIH